MAVSVHLNDGDEREQAAMAAIGTMVRMAGSSYLGLSLKSVSRDLRHRPR